MMKATTTVAVIAVVLLGCFGDKQGYSVRMRNTGARQIDDARVSYGTFTSDVGVLIPHADDTHFEVREPLPRAAVVEWTDADGGRHREAVNVLLPQGFKGVLVFEIDGANHVHVVTESPPRHIIP